MSVDTVADCLTSIRNAIAIKKRVVQVPYSSFKENIIKVLKAEGYIRDYQVVFNEKKFKFLSIQLKYVDGMSAISEIKRVSKQGSRCYRSVGKLGKVIGGLGIYVLSTNKGVMTNVQASINREGDKVVPLGGEVICSIW